MQEKIDKLLSAIAAVDECGEGIKIDEAIDKRFSGEDTEACGVNLNHPVVRQAAEVIMDIATDGQMTLDEFLQKDKG